MVKVQGFINLYRSGFYHRAGKPGNIDVHAGDVYLDREEALKAAEPEKGYFATVEIEYVDETYPVANHIDSVPIPLSTTRREFAEQRKAGKAEHGHDSTSYGAAPISGNAAAAIFRKQGGSAWLA